MNLTIPSSSPQRSALDSFLKTRLHLPPEMMIGPQRYGPVELTPLSYRGALDRVTHSILTKASSEI